MKLSRYDSYTGKRTDNLTMAEAVAIVADRAERGCDDTLERMRYRNEALAGVLGRLLNVLVDNGTLRTTDQVMQVFDYDILAEE